IVEKLHDEKGIIWPESVAPFQVHLIGLDLKDEGIKKKAFEIYNLLTTTYNLEVLFDDREGTNAGEKFSDADLIGIPVRLVVSKRTGEKVEYKKRNEKEAKILSIDEVLKFL
ncbi:MAG: His/Gly/Thr/Pro-type tRNA ligase C-terminal domain-containing protein, partial [Patescibacteria group bacterium]